VIIDSELVLSLVVAHCLGNQYADVYSGNTGIILPWQNEAMAKWKAHFMCELSYRLLSIGVGDTRGECRPGHYMIANCRRWRWFISLSVHMLRCYYAPVRTCIVFAIGKGLNKQYVYTLLSIVSYRPHTDERRLVDARSQITITVMRATSGLMTTHMHSSVS